MPRRCEETFGSIESAMDFLALLAEAISETRQDVDADLQQANSNASRRTDVLRIASYDLEVLQHHLYRSKRIVNDLLMVRRLLLKQRGVPEDKLPAAPELLPPVRLELPVPPPHVPRRRDRRIITEDSRQLVAA